MTTDRTAPVLDIRELRRRKRERILIVITVVVIVLLTFLETHLTRQEAILPISSNVLIFGLININIILIILLIFLIMRNVVKLVYERRHGVIGSRIRTKLVVAFVSLSLIPTFVLFLVSINFLSYSIENWFNIRIGDALNSTLEMAQSSYKYTSDYAKFYARQISGDITKSGLYEKEREKYLRTLVEQRQRVYNIGLLEVHFDKKREKIVVKDPQNPHIVPLNLPQNLLEEVFTGKEVVAEHPAGNGNIISGVAPIYTRLDTGEVIGMVVVGYYIPRAFVEKMAVISKTSEEYKQLSLLKNPIKFTYIVTLSIVTLLIVFSATWFGLFLAKQITVPIQDLADATGRIARGELDYRINISADDEIGTLVDAFNSMTKDLKRSQQNLEQANIDLDQRRKYMEAVLSNVSAGVISVDKGDVITIINRAAERMLEIKTEKVLRRPYQEVLSPEHMALVRELLGELKESENGFVERQLVINVRGRSLTVLVTTTIIRDDDGNYMGMVLVFEDLTQMQKAERAAAWREAARRMAHEIKNPLTPIQLSAQRLQRKYGDRLQEDGEVFQECTRTIVGQVEVLKNLVNAFSRYARMPVMNPFPNDLNEVLSEAVALFQDAHKNISFTFHRDEGIPILHIDPEQIKRVMINLLDNAVAALGSEDGRIEIRTGYDARKRRAVVEVADNGSGVPQKFKNKIFEPYFSTKRSGTGLGLAIVSSIIIEHQGQVNVRDNEPCGTVVTFELPAPGAESPAEYAEKGKYA
ncbi:MAG TPA: ATP-binding protein [Syntrophales bacterium]|nr:ATP-binding protein [Syntrophales bacterium]HOU78120.1 ATP-binding protein [Syntrophales bacterium]HPC32141.1 ATP-binding protein [Syntrophales bacterium]HQG33692.1 ATP-binding protein [Syntrophales bacterium]HQI36258.1 ATP-binding protein [Syntrophales bacterium]